MNNLNISIGTIHNRIAKLEKNGIIEGYTLKLNNEKLGYKLTFLIRIQIDGKHTAEILDQISKIPEVCSVYHTTGEQSAALICRFKEAKDVLEDYLLKEKVDLKYLINEKKRKWNY